MNKSLVKKIVITVLVVVLIAAASVAVYSMNKKEVAEEPKKEPKKVEKVEEPEPEEDKEEPEPANMNVLTGLGTLTDEAIGKRPVAVMVNNVPQAMPQYGISAADVIFEIPVEADNTRLMAMYGDYTQIPQICPIRSLRSYFASYATGFDAFLVHWGKDDSMDEYFDALGLDRYDGISGAGGFFGRDQDKLNQGYALEHTGYFDGTKFANVVQSEGKRLELGDDFKGGAFYFNPVNKEEPAGEEKCTSVNINFGAQSSQFTYDEATKTYKKNMNGSPQIDAKTNEQLSFKNVLVLETSITVRDEVGHKDIDWDGSHDAVGYYISNGTMKKIAWWKSENNEWSRLSFADRETGEGVPINRGKTYVAVNYANQASFE
ncbi:MAG: DUF3048 domain-containing protein [Suipraeoptans sp.]